MSLRFFVVEFLKNKAFDPELQPYDIEFNHQAGGDGRQLHSVPTSGASHCRCKRWFAVSISSALHSVPTKRGCLGKTINHYVSISSALHSVLTAALAGPRCCSICTFQGAKASVSYRSRQGEVRLGWGHSTQYSERCKAVKEASRRRAKPQRKLSVARFIVHHEETK